jgi:hypothetical protein
VALAAILRYVQAKDPEAARNLQIGADCTLSLPLEANVLLKAKQFAHGCAVRQLTLADGTASAVDIDMTTYATREAIKKGRRGFQDHAQLTHAGPGGSPADSEPGPPCQARASTLSSSCRMSASGWSRTRRHWRTWWSTV